MHSRGKTPPKPPQRRVVRGREQAESEYLTRSSDVASSSKVGRNHIHHSDIHHTVLLFNTLKYDGLCFVVSTFMSSKFYA